MVAGVAALGEGEDGEGGDPFGTQERIILCPLHVRRLGIRGVTTCRHARGHATLRNTNTAGKTAGTGGGEKTAREASRLS